MKKILALLFAVTVVLGFSQQESPLEQYKLYQEKGRNYLLQSKYDSAIVMLDTAIAMMPYSHSMYYERGYAYMQLKKYDLAITNFSHVIEKADYKYVAYLNRGICYFEESQFQNAKVDFESTLALDPDNQTAKQFLSETESAIAYYNNQKRQQNNSNKQNEVAARQRQLEQQIIDNRRNQEAIFWGTVIPMIFWSTIFLTW